MKKIDQQHVQTLALLFGVLLLPLLLYSFQRSVEAPVMPDTEVFTGKQMEVSLQWDKSQRVCMLSAHGQLAEAGFTLRLSNLAGELLEQRAYNGAQLDQVCLPLSRFNEDVLLLEVQHGSEVVESMLL